MQGNLTQREKELMELLVLGKTNPELAEDMFVSIHTIKSMLEKLFRKFEVKSRVQLAIKYVKEKNQSNYDDCKYL